MRADRRPGRGPVTRRTFVSGAALGVASLFLSGCMDWIPDPPSPVWDQAAVVPDSQLATQSPAEGGGTALKGGTLSFGTLSPICLAPWLAQTVSGSQLVKLVFEPLTSIDDATGELVGRSALGWESNATGTHYTFYLRDDMTFHDGAQVTSADFVRAWQTLVQSAAVGDLPTSLLAPLSCIRGYESVLAGETGSTLALTCPGLNVLGVDLTAPDYEFPLKVASPLFAPIPQAAVDDAAGFASRPVGNGAFQVNDVLVDGTVELVPYAAYPLGTVNIGSLRCVPFENVGDAYDAFTAGKLDCAMVPGARVLDAVSAYGLAADLESATAGHGVLTAPGQEVHALVFGQSSDVFDDLRVREVVSKSIDRAELVATVWPGYADPCWGCVPDAFTHPWPSPSRWPACQGSLDMDGGALGLLPTTLSLTYAQGSAAPDLLGYLDANLASLGVSLHTRELSWDEYRVALAEGDFELAYAAVCPDWTSASGYLNVYLSSVVGSSAEGYVDGTARHLLAEAAAADGDERTELLSSIDAFLGQSLPFTPLFVRRNTYVTSNRVNNLQCNLLGFIDFAACWLSA